MSILRPTSITDAALLQRLESRNSYTSEPSSPTLQNCSNPKDSVHTTKASLATADTTAIKSSPTPLNDTQSKNNNKIDLTFDDFMKGRGGIIDHTKLTKMEYRSGMRQICFRVALDFFILCCVGLPVMAFHLWGVAYKRGFFCDDKTLKHPYNKSTVNNWMLCLMCFVLPISIIITVEFFVSNYNRTHGIKNLAVERYYIGRLEIADWIVESYKSIGFLIFGSGVGQLTMDVAKYSIGRLRPHFIAVCQPVLADGSTCDDNFNGGRYIEEFTCTGDSSTRMLKQMRLSFPSAHASFACFTMIYMANRMTWQRCKMVKHFIQYLLLMFAWYTGLTRVSDYQHHPMDVLAGSAIGALYAFFLARTTW
ncbi:putative phosphatidate phosphatase isoform X2 [Eurosta solidaginis]|uniref:putative phosphatidate phosphatase isoform X2 n=1 Tax=Eurosta solidaginis TaxID=178769 RepID=UPI0035308960